MALLPRPRPFVFLLAFLFALWLVALPLPKAQASVGSPDPGSDQAAMAPDALPLDHFWCYKTKGDPLNVTVGLQDQFNPVIVTHVVGAPFRFCNPAAKRHAGIVYDITHPDDHLTWYRLQIGAAGPNILVKVSNQFGKRNLTVFTPAVALAVPTQKSPHGPPKDTDHFKCYRVQGDPVNVRVDLRDQFTNGTDLAVGYPRLLCNPTLKVHNNTTFPIKYPQAHLVCYDITVVRFSKLITISNQFQNADLTVSKAHMLCVPSRKRIL